MLSVALLSDYGVLDNIHLVGHSLGAHVMGSAAKEVQRLGLGKLRRLTGLDPAYPFFESEDLYPWRVDRSDADLVQILHTNSGFLWDGCLSFKVTCDLKRIVFTFLLVRNLLGMWTFSPLAGVINRDALTSVYSAPAST